MGAENLATVLILISAAMHATWNAILKSGNDRTAMIGVMNIVGAAVSLPLLYLVPVPTLVGWGWITISIFIHLIYQLGLTRMLASADYSLVYPIARGTGPLIVTIISLLFLSENLSTIEVVAILILISGAVIAGLGGHHHTQKKPKASAFLWAIFVGLMIGFYTLVDGSAVKQMDPLQFILWSNILIMPFMMLFLLKRDSKQLGARMLKVWPRASIMTLFSLGGYTIALFAFRLGGLAEIAALRETSILFAALIGFFWLKERLTKRRITGIALIATGAAALKLI